MRILLHTVCRLYIYIRVHNNLALIDNTLCFKQVVSLSLFRGYRCLRMRVYESVNLYAIF